MAITGKSPVEFILRLRLKRAEQLLKDPSLNVSEVAYQIGFNNPKVFAKYFKIEFGQLRFMLLAVYAGLFTRYIGRNMALKYLVTLRVVFLSRTAVRLYK